MPRPEFWPLGQNTSKDDDDEVHDDSLFLQKQLGDMEGEVKEIQMELASIRKDRLDLYNRKHYKTENETYKKNNNVNPFDEYPTGDRNQHHSEISKLKTDLIRAKNSADEERFQRLKYEEKLKDFEYKLNNVYTSELKPETKIGIRPDLLTQQDTVATTPRNLTDAEESALKAQIRDMKDEMEEMRMMVAEKNEQLQDYRVKYLQAEQQVEELRRQLDSQDYDNKQISDQIQYEIQKMKFQEKLQELSPLPDLLKGAQIQLQEAKQLQGLAEDSCQQLSSELQRVKEKLVIAVNHLNQEKLESKQLYEDNVLLKSTLDERLRMVQELEKELDSYKCQLLRVEEKLHQQDLRFQEKSKECAQVINDLNELRSESSRALTRNKERTDSMRRYLQTQISEMERQLIQSRAQSKACYKERDEIRQRIQVQLGTLQENFELVEIRLRALQNQVTSLKNSYTVVLADDEESDFKIVSS